VTAAAPPLSPGSTSQKAPVTPELDRSPSENDMNHIEELLKRVIDQAAEGNTSFCVLLESKSSPDQWVQLSWDTINAAYPFAQEPMEKLRELKLPEFPYLEISGWEPHKVATFEHGADDLKQIAAFVTAYFKKVLGVSAATKDLRTEEQQL
jgi:hypothetical protein